MATTTHQRNKSGETCRETGAYEFDGYVDGSMSPAPSPDEMEVTVASGAPFPTPRTSQKACYWKPAEDTRDDDARQMDDEHKHDDDE